MLIINNNNILKITNNFMLSYPVIRPVFNFMLNKYLRYKNYFNN